jgi:ferric-dicitrate binding protein FerR (iron transport regulator)
MTEPNDDDLRLALDAWQATPPPPGFADRVLAARPAVRAPRSNRRRFAAVAVALALAASAALAVGVHSSTSGVATHGSLASPNARTTAQLGDRAVAVAEPDAQLRWDIAADGTADLTQSAGDIFYRVDHGGGPLVVHTPAGDIHVTGTCFRIEVQMNKPAQLILASVASAAVASAVVVTVYEGRVVADSHGARSELAAGTRTVLGAPSSPALVASADPTTPADLAHATREQLVARLAAQDRELAALRAAGPSGPHPILRHADGTEDTGEPPPLQPLDQPSRDGRPWFNPSADTLRDWAKDCHVRFDEPDFAHNPGVGGARGITADELPEYTAAMADVQQQFHTLVRALYLASTGDTVGADSLSIDAMSLEIRDKAAPGEVQAIMARVAQERAGLAVAPSADAIAHASPVEQLIRAQLGLGDATQAAIAKLLGPDRAAAIRGDGWPRRSEISGCPDQK